MYVKYKVEKSKRKEEKRGEKLSKMEKLINNRI